MTTIAWDGKTLCSDSLLSCGDMRLGSVQKVFKARLGGKLTLFAGAGNHANWYSVVAWMVNGANVDEKPSFETSNENDFTLVVINKETTCYWTPTMTPVPAPMPFVVAGSGEAYALAALTLGKTAREAVELAIKLDCASGGEIQEATLED